MNTVEPLNITEISNQTISLLVAAKGGDDSLRFIFVPLAVLMGIVGLSALVYLMARNRRKLVNIYKLVQAHNCSQSDHVDVENYDDPTESLLPGKLQIDNYCDKYQISVSGRGDLYT